MTGPPTVVTRARWLRILYQLSLSPIGRPNTSTTEQSSAPFKTETILVQILEILRSNRTFNRVATDTSGSSTYPKEEVEYLATSTFNRAIDAYIASDREGCSRLGQIAVELAESMADDGAMKGIMTKRLVSLLGTEPWYGQGGACEG